MARPIWNGTISFGLVSVPVGLYSATGDHDISFNQLQRGTTDRVRYRRVNERTGDEVAFADIVKGYDVGGGEYVIVEPDDLDALAPSRSKAIEIKAFVDLDQIDPIYFAKTYYLAPVKAENAQTYSLLAQALQRSGKAGIAMFVMRGKQYLTVLRAQDGLLLLETLFFANEVRDPHAELPTLRTDLTFDDRELDLAGLLIDSMATQWTPQDYRDTYTQAVLEMIEAKHAGREIVAAQPSAPTGTVTDLLAALQASIDAAKGSSPTAGADPGPTTAAGAGAPTPRKTSSTESASRKRSGKTSDSASSASASASANETASDSANETASDSADDSADETASEQEPATRPTATRRTPAARSGPAPSVAVPDNLDSLSRKELDALARALGIAGRSSMDKAALQAAVAAAKPASRRRRAS